MRTHRPELVATNLVAVVIAMIASRPHVLTLGRDGGVASLPAGALRSQHRSLQSGLRDWVTQLTGHRLGHVEQLYTFADRERLGAHQRLISVSYLGLAGTPDAPTPSSGENGAGGEPAWRDVYTFFPGEDRRGSGVAASTELASQLRFWTRDPALATDTARKRALRVDAAFGVEGDDSPSAPGSWTPEGVLARYELAWEAGLVPEAHRGHSRSDRSPLSEAIGGAPMLHDHRRILATGLARLRSTIQYRPLLFELMPEAFTLRQLQDCVEAISGTSVHAPNFRRLVLGQDLVEETGERVATTGGRPARLYRFRAGTLPDHQVALALPRSRQ